LFYVVFRCFHLRAALVASGHLLCEFLLRFRKISPNALQLRLGRRLHGRPFGDRNEGDGDIAAPVGLQSRFVVEVKYVDTSFFVGLRHAPAREVIFIFVALIRALDDCVLRQGRTGVTAAELRRHILSSHGDCASECSPGTCLFLS